MVDSSSRGEVLAFYHAVYGASEGYASRVGWTGDVAGLLPGTTSAALKEDVLRRINFYRALAGLPADLTLNFEKSAKAQEAALIMARNGGLSHAPALESPSWIGTEQFPSGVEASASSNLSLGAFGPAAVDGQIRDDGAANWQVGHRRWLLSPSLSEVGTGDVPPQAGFQAANAVWVYGNFRSVAPPRFVTWPARGYFPVKLLPKRWSVAYAGADFSAATVRVIREGEPLAVRILSRSEGPADGFQGEKTLVWEPALAIGNGREDVRYRVEVTGIRIGAELRSFNYDVVAFDPEELGETPSITGPGSVTVFGSSYGFRAAPQVDSHDLTVARGSAAPWMEGAEGPDALFFSETSQGYAVVQSQVVASGGRAFHLTHPGGAVEGFTDQILQLRRRLVPGPDSVLQFSETGRFAETTTTLNAEVSVDDGRTWTAVWSRRGVGLHSALFDAGWNPHAVKLDAYSGRALLVRFSLKSNGGPVAAGTTRDHGFFVDNIVLTNGVELVEAKVTTLAAGTSGFELNRTIAGASLMEGNNYYLSLAPRIGGHLFPSGGLKVVSVPVVSALASAAVQDPTLIRVQPFEVRVAAGFSAVFSVVATGAGTLTYQWRKNGVPVPGGTQSTYRIEDVETTDGVADAASGFDVVVTGGGGSVTSTRVGLTVVEGGAYLTEHPAGSSLIRGTTYTLRVTAVDSDAKYQWRKNGSPISGGTGSTYTISGVSDSDAGRYDVAVTTWAGTVSSMPAYVGVASKVVPNLQGATYNWAVLAGNHGFPGWADGTGSVAQFNRPSAIAMDRLGNLFVSDTGNHVIRRVMQTGVVTTVAGKAGISGTLNGSATSVARFESPAGIAIDPAGSVYIAEPESNTIRKLINPISGGTVTTIAGVAGRFDLSEGLNGPSRLAVDSSSSLYFMDLTSIRRVESENRFTLLHGELRDKYTGTKPLPVALAVDAGGRLFAAVSEGNEFKILSKTLTGSFVATNYGPYSFPIVDLALGGGNNLFAATDSIVQLLGDVSQSFPGGGLPRNLIPAVDSDMAPGALTVDSQGTVFAVDPYAHTVIRGVPTGLPVFILQPQGATGQEGVPLTLTAAAVGEGTVTYQWYRDGFLIGGATSASHTMASGGTSVGDYTVVASNLAGAVTSGTARVEGRVAPLVISTFLPPAVAVVSGSSTTFAVDWEGPSNTTFQWFRNGVPVSGATSAVLKFAPARGSDAGTYRVTVQAGTTVLSGGTVHFTVNVPVSIFNQPEAEVAILQGKPLALRVSAAGTPPLSYQWVRNGTEILGGTGSSYAIAQMNDVSAGTYTVRVRNAFGQVESEPSRVSVVVPPVVTIQSEARRFVNELGGLTLSVSATGTAPLSYQWRKDGVPIGGGTSTALTLQAMRAQDAGFYDVVVANAAGSETSRPVQVSVNLPPRIVVRPPASIDATAGTAVPLRVVAAGTGPFSYQWFVGGVPIAGGTSSDYEVKTVVAGTAQTAVYSVRVTSPSHPDGAPQEMTTLTVRAGRRIAVLREPAAQTNVIRGTAAVLKLSVDPNTPDVSRTTYRLLTLTGASTGVSGLVPASGGIDVAMRSLTTSGSYKVSLSREYSDGTVGEAVVGPFAVELRTLEDAAGTYELLVNDLNGLIGDGALYRGMILASVTKTGAVSGRVLYNEAAPLVGATGSERAYWAVARSFSSVFVPSEADPSKLVCAPRLGVGTQANRQALELELDFSAKTVELSALVRDTWSARSQGESLSQGSGAVRGLTKLTGVLLGGGSADLSSLAGRHAIGSEFGLMWRSGPGADNNATLFAQVLPTGKVVWGSRLSGSTGTGSATLSGTSQEAVFAQIYQGRTTSAGPLSTSSLLGQLRFERASGGTSWSASVLTSSGDDRLERQSCYVKRDTNGAHAFDPELFDLAKAGSSGFNWSEVRALDFQGGSTCRWPGSAGRDLAAFFNVQSSIVAASPAPLYLTAEDPEGGQTYVWTIAMSATGMVRASNYFPATVQPTLTFRLDRTRGEWTGSFISTGTRLRCSLFGTVVRPGDGGPLRGAGWLEAGVVPATRTSSWKLDLVAP